MKKDGFDWNVSIYLFYKKRSWNKTQYKSSIKLQLLYKLSIFNILIKNCKNILWYRILYKKIFKKKK